MIEVNFNILSKGTPTSSESLGVLNDSQRNLFAKSLEIISEREGSTMKFCESNFSNLHEMDKGELPLVISNVLSGLKFVDYPPLQQYLSTVFIKPAVKQMLKVKVNHATMRDILLRISLSQKVCHIRFSELLLWVDYYLHFYIISIVLNHTEPPKNAKIGKNSVVELLNHISTIEKKGEDVKGYSEKRLKYIRESSEMFNSIPKHSDFDNKDLTIMVTGGKHKQIDQLVLQGVINEIWFFPDVSKYEASFVVAPLISVLRSATGATPMLTEAEFDLDKYKAGGNYKEYCRNWVRNVFK